MCYWAFLSKQPESSNRSKLRMSELFKKIYDMCNIGLVHHLSVYSLLARLINLTNGAFGGPFSLPAFKSFNAMLMQALHSLISCFPLACPLQFAANGPTTTPSHPTPSIHLPTPFLPIFTLLLSLSHSLSLSSSSLEASRFSSFTMLWRG